jgi:phosphonate transport system substrate-binding protein
MRRSRSAGGGRGPAGGMLLLAVFLFLGGCGEGGERVVVDFSQTVSAARPGQSPSPRPALRVGVAAMISPRETFNLYRELADYVSRGVGKELQFVQRKTYSEINELLEKGEMEVALLCSGPYATAKARMGVEPLAVPVIHGSQFYHSFLIVGRDSPYQRLEDLRGRSFAFTDPHSNTGKLVPTFWLAERGERPESFFSQIIYTYSHDNSILAVARGLVDGAAVDGLVWEYYQEKRPALAARTKIIKKSEPYGNPPLVASRSLSEAERQQVRQVLLTMHQSPQGRKILEELLIERFVPLQEEWYDAIRRMHSQLRGKEGAHEAQNP